MTENVLKALSSRGGKAALGRHFFGGGGEGGEREKMFLATGKLPKPELQQGNVYSWIVIMILLVNLVKEDMEKNK